MKSIGFRVTHYDMDVLTKLPAEQLVEMLMAISRWFEHEEYPTFNKFNKPYSNLLEAIFLLVIDRTENVYGEDE